MSIFRQKLTTFVFSKGVPFVRCYPKWWILTEDSRRG